jgi:predicted glycosyltransferase
LPDIQILEFESILKSPGPESSARPAPLRCVQFPSFAVSSAVDVMITGAGYNSFHECLFGSIPAVFVPNEAPELDDQLLRARFAATAGMALYLRGSDIDRVPAVLSTALQADARRTMRKRMASLRFENGAHTAVALLTQLASSLRADRPLAANINRL